MNKPETSEIIIREANKADFQQLVALFLEIATFEMIEKARETRCNKLRWHVSVWNQTAFLQTNWR